MRGNWKVKAAAALSVGALGAAGILGVSTAILGVSAASVVADNVSKHLSISTTVADMVIQGWIPGVGKPP